MIDVRRRGRVILLAYLLFCIVYLGAPMLSVSSVKVLEASAIDQGVPFTPWTIAIYASQFLFLFLTLWLSPTSEDLKNLLAAIAVATAISAAIFIVWPTAINRPDPHNAAFSALYLFDVPTNCFPSLHVALAIIAAAMWPHRRTRPLAWLWAFAILVSTLTTKQHVAVDILAGAVVGVVALIWTGVVERRLVSFRA